MALTEGALVSVLIPLFNGIELLPECLASVRAQTYQRFEVLIGVNGHDETSSVLARARALSDERVKVVHFPDLASAPLTLNRLAEQAQSEVVCLLDADDVWRPEKIARQLRAFQEGHHVVGTFCEYFGERSGSPRLPAGPVPAQAFFRANPMIHSSVMMRRQDVRFREEFLYDYDLWLRLEASGRSFFNVAANLTFHRIHSASMFNAQPHSELRKQDLLLRHAGSARGLWWSRLPWPLRRSPPRRPSLDAA